MIFFFVGKYWLPIRSSIKYVINLIGYKRCASFRHRISIVQNYLGVKLFHLPGGLAHWVMLAIIENHGLIVYHIQDVDESLILTKDMYISMIANKAYSLLHLLNENDFRTGLHAMEANLARRRVVKHTMRVKLVVSGKEQR